MEVIKSFNELVEDKGLFTAYPSSTRGPIFSIEENYQNTMRNSAHQSELIESNISLIRQSRLFHREWYLSTYPDVAAAGVNPELHYLCYGGFEGRDPSILFSSKAYDRDYPDVLRAGMNPLLHYLLYGKSEGRRIQASMIERGELSDVEWSAREFVRVFGKPMDFENPHTFSEKIQLYKLFYHPSNLWMFADKYAVRPYVADVIGEQYLIPLVGVFSSTDEIDPGLLPDQFIIKATHGSGWNLICHDKQNWSWETNKPILDEWLHSNFSDRFREWVYVKVPHRLVIEKLLLNESGEVPKDYKIFCCDGKPILVHVDSGRFGTHTRNIYDPNWNLLPFSLVYPQSGQLDNRPVLLDQMLDIASKLSKGFPFVRVDLYTNPDIYFGEMTFYPGAGYRLFNPDGWDAKLGEAIHFPDDLRVHFEQVEGQMEGYDLDKLRLVHPQAIQDVSSGIEQRSLFTAGIRSIEKKLAVLLRLTSDKRSL